MELVGGASHFSLLAADAASAVVSATTTPSKTRVGGIDLAAYAGTWSSTLPSAGSHWASTYSYGELAADRQEVTNLRLPGQYDERLFAAAGLSGLQGPYYNWNRWYLPSVGRYMELDPIAMAGGFNGAHGPDWYTYANGNPLTYTDESGMFAPPPPVVIGIGRGILIGIGALCSMFPQLCWSPSHPPPQPKPVPPSPPFMPCHAGPSPFGPPGVRPAPPQPVPSEQECDQEWARAAEICNELMRNPRAIPNPRGGRRSMDQCMKGYVSEVCGGNPLDWGPDGPFGR